MNTQEAKQFADLIKADAKLREEFRNDPNGVVEAHGLSLSAQERLDGEGFRGLFDAQMLARISKYTP